MITLNSRLIILLRLTPHGENRATQRTACWEPDLEAYLLARCRNGVGKVHIGLEVHSSVGAVEDGRKTPEDLHPDGGTWRAGTPDLGESEGPDLDGLHQARVPLEVFSQPVTEDRLTTLASLFHDVVGNGVLGAGIDPESMLDDLLIGDLNPCHDEEPVILKSEGNGGRVGALPVCGGIVELERGPLRVQLDDVRLEELGAHEPTGPLRNGHLTQVDHPGIRDLELERATGDCDRADMVDGDVALPRAGGRARFDDLQLKLPRQHRVEHRVRGSRIDAEPERTLSVDFERNEDQLALPLAFHGRDRSRGDLRCEDTAAKRQRQQSDPGRSLVHERSLPRRGALYGKDV